MVKRIHIFLLATLLTFGVAVSSQAALFDAAVATKDIPVVGPAGVFPIWFQDFADPTLGPANPGYGIGPTAGGLKLELCTEQGAVVEGICIFDPAGEAVYWAAGANMDVPGIPTGRAGLVIAVEAVFAPAPAPPGGELVLNVMLTSNMDVTVPGLYTITTPYGVFTQTVTAAEIDPTRPVDVGAELAVGLGAAPGFRGALAGPIGAFLIPTTGVTVPGVDVDPLDANLVGKFFLFNPGALEGTTTVLGSPFGTNIFRIDGPPGSNYGGPGIDFVETDQFTVTGQIFLPAVVTAPVAVADAAATRVATPVVIDVLLNDTFADVAINPASVQVATQPAGGTADVVVVDGLRKAIQYTPRAGFTGADTITYTINNFANMPATGTISVFVEDLKVSKAEFRPKFLKWRISGSSSDAIDNNIGILVGPPMVSGTLSGAQETPPIVSPGSGTASVTVGDTSINFNLSITGLLNITSTHLHHGTSGAILFTLGGANVTTVVDGTLTAANLNPAAGVTFADAVNAILSGNSYVQVHTIAVPAGEIRGQLGPNRMVATVPVNATNGTWVLDGKSPALPGESRTISVRSSNGVQVIDVPLKVK